MSKGGRYVRSGALCTSLLPLALAPLVDGSEDVQQALRCRTILCLAAVALVISATRAAEGRIREVPQLLQFWLLGTIGTHFLAVAAGAPIFRSCLDTLQFASLLSATVAAPASEICSVAHLPSLLISTTRGVRQKLSSSQLALSLQIYATVIGCLAGVWPITLDKESPVWQVWPFGLLVGTAAGSLLGHAVSALLLLGPWNEPAKHTD